MSNEAQPDLVRILSAIGEGVVAMDRDLRYVFINDAAVSLVGIPRETALGRTPLELFPPEVLDQALSTITQAMATQQPVQYDAHFPAVDRWYENRLYPTPDGVAIVFTDITDRRRSEEAVRRNRDVLALAMRGGRMGAWARSMTTNGVWWSRELEELFGLPPGGFTGTEAGFFEFVHEKDRPLVEAAVRQALANRDDYIIEFRFRHANGQWRWMEGRGRAVYAPDGTPTTLYGIGIDITERKAAEQELAAARDAARLLLQVDDAVRPLLDPEEITFTAARLLGEHLRVNRCAYATVEEDEDTFVLTGNYTEGTHSIVGTYRFRQFGAECLRLMRAGEPYVVSDSDNDPRVDPEDLKAYRATSIRSVICVPIRKAGRFVAAMAVHCVTPREWRAAEVELLQQVASRSWESIERARVEHQRAQLLEMAESANRAKDEFLAMLGHELRNPLSPIVTALQLMRLRAGNVAERERTVIERQVAHLTRLVDDLLDVSRIARGKVALKLEVIELAEIVARALEVASPLLEQRSHRLALDVPSRGLAVEGDAARLAQVVSNLLTNAAKYTPHGGEVSIRAALEGDEVVLRVRDTGVGIPADVLPRVFDLFVQGRQQIDRSQGGLGLGLTIVRSLVERHGGTVSAHSSGAGAGSEFIVRLPAAHAGAPRGGDQSTDAQAVLPTARGIRVLIVDDNADAAEMLALALDASGYVSTIATDALQALALASAGTFDVACVDIGLPVMDGYELAARLRELPHLQSLRLVAVTGYGQASDRQRAFEAGFDEHVVKPVDLDALAALLAQVQASS